MALQVLDIDLDAFLNQVVHWKAGNRRLNKKNYIPWTENRLRNFLENQCGLSVDNPIPGMFAIHHDQAFDFMASLHHSDGGPLINVVHVDAHADLGLGDPSWVDICWNTLHLPLSQRLAPRRGPKHLNPGSFMAYAAAARLLSRLVYVYPPGGGNDIPIVHLLENSRGSGALQLKAFPPTLQQEYLSWDISYEELDATRANQLEPTIPFEEIEIDDYKAQCRFDIGFLCQSPGFTPSTSDKLIPVIGEYISFDNINSIR